MRTSYLCATVSVLLFTATSQCFAGSFYEKYAGATIIVSSSSVYNGKTVTSTHKMKIEENGVSFTGIRFLKEKNEIRVDKNTTVNISTRENKIIIESHQKDIGHKSKTTITISGSSCSSSVSDTHSSISSSCKIALGPLVERPNRDNASACQAVQKAIAEIRSLAKKNQKLRAEGKGECEMWKNAAKIKEIGTSIKAAACSSKLKEVDRMMKSEPRNRCGDPYITGGGVRG